MKRFLLLLVAGATGCLGATLSNQGLIAVGRIPADTLDATGQDNIGGVFSAMAVAPATWSCTGNVCAGTVYGLADRGYGNGTVDYRPRIEVFQCGIDMRTGHVTLTNTAAILLTQTEGVNFSGLIAPPAGLPRLDPEGLARLANGDFDVSEEYGPDVMRFGGQGRWQETLPVPEIYRHRRDNRGFEGLTMTPDGKRLVALLQSPLLTDGGANNDSRNTRLLVFENDKPVAEYVYPLTLNGNHKHTKNTPVSELLAIDDHRYLVLERDNGGVGGEGPSLYKRINLADTAGATDILHTSHHERLPPSDLPADVQPVRKSDFIDLLDAAALARVGLRPEELPEKWEGLALVPLPKAHEYLLLVGTDNDFKAETVIINGQPVGHESPVATLVLVYRVTLP